MKIELNNKIVEYRFLMLERIIEGKIRRPSL